MIFNSWVFYYAPCSNTSTHHTKSSNFQCSKQLRSLSLTVKVIHTKANIQLVAVRSAGDDTDNGDTGDNAEDNGYHLEIISSPLWPQWRARCVIVAVLGPSSRTIQFVVTDISIIHSGSILICLQYPHYHSSASGSIKMIRALKSFSVLRWDNPHKICSGQIFALERPRTICNLMVKAKAFQEKKVREASIVGQKRWGCIVY